MNRTILGIGCLMVAGLGIIYELIGTNDLNPYLASSLILLTLWLAHTGD